MTQQHVITNGISYKACHEIVIDEEFRALIPPLGPEEFALLEENIKRDGCREPLTVCWQMYETLPCKYCSPTEGEEMPVTFSDGAWVCEACGYGLAPNEYILLDGHHRYEICKRNGIPFETFEVELFTREEMADWIDANQLGRRNLTPDQMSLLRGRRYNRFKKRGGAPQGNENAAKQLPQIEAVVSRRTSEVLASQHGVSRATIERDGQFASAVERVKVIEPDIEGLVISGSGPVKSAVVEAAKLVAEAPEAAMAILRGEATMSGVIREVKREAYQAQLEDIKAKEVKALQGVYDVIVIDPPWPIVKIERDVRPNQVGLDYPTMSLDEIRKLSIPAAGDCHLWLWATQATLVDAFSILTQWGFRYLCTFVWHKPGGFQPVGLPQYNCEFVIYGRKGSPIFVSTKALPVCFEAPRGAHSEKPEAFYDIVRRITAGRRLDMFNRRPIEGFDAWGNEA
jgi:N6-adenosine-specific RNA methylase IME4